MNQQLVIFGQSSTDLFFDGAHVEPTSPTTFNVTTENGGIFEIKTDAPFASCKATGHLPPNLFAHASETKRGGGGRNSSLAAAQNFEGLDVTFVDSAEADSEGLQQLAEAGIESCDLGLRAAPKAAVLSGAEDKRIVRAPFQTSVRSDEDVFAALLALPVRMGAWLLANSVKDRSVFSFLEKVTGTEGRRLALVLTNPPERDPLLALIPKADVLIGSNEEIPGLLGLPIELGILGSVRLAKKLSQTAPGAQIHITMGEHGSIVSQGGRTWFLGVGEPAWSGIQAAFGATSRLAGVGDAYAAGVCAFQATRRLPRGVRVNNRGLRPAVLAAIAGSCTAARWLTYQAELSTSDFMIVDLTDRTEPANSPVRA